MITTRRRPSERAAATLRITAVVAVVGALLWVVAARGVSDPVADSTQDDPLVGGEIAATVPGTVQEGARLYVTSPAGRTLVCTTGAVLSADVAVTAAHCGPDGSTITLTDSAAAPVVGHIQSRYPAQDLAIISLAPDAPVGDVSTLSTTPLTRGERLAAHGATSGRITGYVLTGELQDNLSRSTDGTDNHTQIIDTTVCLRPGDSGGPVVRAGTDQIVGLAVSERDTRQHNQCRGQISPVAQWPISIH